MIIYYYYYYSAKKAFAKFLAQVTVGESISRAGNLRAFKASWSVETQRKRWRLGDRLPGRLLLRRRRYNWDDSEDSDNDL